MPNHLLLHFVAIALLVLLSSGTAKAEGADPPKAPSDEFREAHRSARRTESVVNKINQTTGMAPSPWMVMGVGGARRYLQTPEAQRGNIGFFARPWVWGPMILIVLLVGMKDTLSSFAGPLKPIFDSVAELVHASGAVLGVGFLALTIYDTGEVPPPSAEGSASLQTASGSRAADPEHRTGTGPAVFADAGAGQSEPPPQRGTFGKIGHFIGSTVTFVCALVIYAAVWVTFNMIEAVILINPIPWVEHLLKSFRLVIIGIITTAEAIHPLLGLLVSLPIILVCFYLSHFAIKITIMALVYSFGLLQRMFVGGRPSEGATLWAFSSRHFSGVGLFSFGYLDRSDGGQWEFVYKRLFLFFTRRVPLPDELTLVVGIGSINPYVIGISEDGAQRRVLLRFSPRYLRYHEHLREELDLSDVVDISLTTSIKKAFAAVWKWVRTAFGGKPVRPVAKPVRRSRP